MNDDLEIKDEPTNDKGDRLNSFIENYEKELAGTGSHTSLNIDYPADESIDEEVETKDVNPNEEKQPTGNKKSLSKLIKPKFAVNILNLILPSIIVLVLSRLGYYIEKKKMQLDEEEREMLQPFVDDFLETIQLNFDNPYTNLLVGVSLVWGIKIVDAIPEIRKEAPKPKKESDLVQFESEYNENIERIRKDKKKKTLLQAQKYFAEEEPQRLNELFEKYGIEEERERYLNPKNN